MIFFLAKFKLNQVKFETTCCFWTLIVTEFIKHLHGKHLFNLVSNKQRILYDAFRPVEVSNVKFILAVSIFQMCRRIICYKSINTFLWTRSLWNITALTTSAPFAIQNARICFIVAILIVFRWPCSSQKPR